MIRTVNSAFDKFMKDVVNLDKDSVANARSSMKNLLDNIQDFDNDEFFHLWKDINIQYGSFARKTKCRKLDDIDLMIGISADGATYDGSVSWNDIAITASYSNQTQQDCANEDGTLNSTKVINAFKKKLAGTKDYCRSELHKNGQAVTLNLLSKEWNFDIVPCFHTVREYDGRAYYLIPNGKGNWMKTDPERDREYVLEINKNHGGKAVELVRLCKRWIKTKKVTTPMSYLMETLIIQYCEQKDELDDFIDIRFADALKYLQTAIFNPVYDIKDIQGDINNLAYGDKFSISEKAKIDYEKAKEANSAEIEEDNQEKAMNLWRDIFGDEFPKYGS
ncbi:MAG: hypothetical protein J6I73_07735 [Treponema sp.]|nr:hypothetical protein [Treponema sp.]